MMPDHPTLSVLVPCFNEERTIATTLGRLSDVLSRSTLVAQAEIIVVDDCSRDRTVQVVEEFVQRGLPANVRLTIRVHPTNAGKGRAVRTAREAVTGDVVIIQDADLEYSPEDIPAVIRPILEGRADAVLGSRFVGGGVHRVLYFWHRVGNGLLTLLSNMCTDLNVTDMETGYKAFHVDVFRCMHLTTPRFGLEPEMVARLSQMEARVYEVPISYDGRTYAEGKKIGWRDGIAAIWHILSAQQNAHLQPCLAEWRASRAESGAQVR